MYNPVSTYTVQLNGAFGFKELEQIMDYLSGLGIGTFYASPVFSSVKGSMHGYDSVDPTMINPEIGTVEELQNLSKRFHERGIGWLQDIVPNHMAYSTDNRWLMDVLEKGKSSAYHHFFDTYPGERLIGPFLGKDTEQAIQDGELTLALKNKKFYLQYFDSYYPLRVRSYATVFSQCRHQPDTLATWVSQLRADSNEAHADALSQQLNTLLADAEIVSLSEECLGLVNEKKDTLLQIANEQHYELVHWQEANSRLNYRRFFTINGLISLNIQNDSVFGTYHKFTDALLKQGAFNGLRIDHIDGLYDPTEYLQRLRQLTGEDCYIVVEKILEPGEALAKDWPIQGSTGYDFLGLVNQLLTNGKAKKKFEQFYLELTGDDTSPKTQLHRKKSYILYRQMAADLNHLVREFYESGLIPAEQLKEQEQQFKETLATLLIYCPVYRYYPSSMPLKENDAAALQSMLREIKKDKPWLLPSVHLLRDLWLTIPPTFSSEDHKKALHLYRRCMQYSGPLMAKGKEDTLMYTYCRFMGHNEVGDGVERFGISIDDFHKAMMARRLHQPHALNATSTHDTKMGEDVRARLAVLTDLADEWLKAAGRWLKTGDASSAPDANERYFLLQVILGAHPMPGESTKSFKERLKEYIPKALREAKIHSEWTRPDTDYESQTAAFATELLSDNSPIYHQQRKFLNKITDFGIVNSLAQLLLKCTCPGVPDIYQGTELWDLSLVDPDNHRPVDYEKRIGLLDFINRKKDSPEDLMNRLWADRYSGGIKLWMLHKLLEVRRQHKELFFEGDYIPLRVKGKHRHHIIAFARYYSREWLLVITALHVAELCDQQKCGMEEIDWADTHVALPSEAPRDFQNLWTGEKGFLTDDLQVSQLFTHLPMALVKLAAPPNERKAGILLAVSSLPSGYGIGDLGPGARKFADFLKRSQQRIWQMLPLNPVEAANGYSPYSSISSMACNSLFISPDDLIQDGLLFEKDVKPFQVPADKRVDYEWAETGKNILLDVAYERFEKQAGQFMYLHRNFEEYCKEHEEWLNDFAQFSTLKNHFKTTWNLWPGVYRYRDETALKQWELEHTDEIRKIKWREYMFQVQWQRLRGYCRIRGIELLGDLPFYVNYDSADVWAHPKLFVLDEQFGIKAVAGVPPDYFSEGGQLWGMPTFNWEELKQCNYGWWIRRLKRNLELFDNIRLDHFRAFDAYWEVSAGDKDARGGTWKAGPGKAFFELVKKELGRLPFVAEDLGDNMNAVYRLRDAVGLPGMKVLQFAFGEQSGRSVDIPHNYDKNYLVYTGTHDNNTTKGWYAEETTADDRRRIEQYFDTKITGKNIHTILSRAGYASIANTVILPMQDVLGLDAFFRMNKPGVADGNWTWSLVSEQLGPALERQLRKWVQLYNRY